jgi:hypothetical protein
VAADVFFDVDEVGAEGQGQLQVVVASPGDDRLTIGADAVGKADPALFGYVEFAAQLPVVGFEEVGAGVFGGDGDVADLLGFEAIGGGGVEVVGVVFGVLGAGK